MKSSAAVGKYCAFGSISSQKTWSHALTVLNESSDTTDNASHEVGRSSWKWIGLIGALAFLVVCLNTSLFLLVQRHEREIAEREVDAQRRLVLVEAKEAQRSALT